MCSSICKCIGCKNFEESPERKTLMHLADAAEVRVQQQTAAKTKLSSQISDLLTRTTPVISSGGGRYQSTRLHAAIRKNCVMISTKLLHEGFFLAFLGVQYLPTLTVSHSQTLQRRILSPVLCKIHFIIVF